MARKIGPVLKLAAGHHGGEKAALEKSGSNLLNGSKGEEFNKVTTIQDQIDRRFGEYELKSEAARFSKSWRATLSDFLLRRQPAKGRSRTLRPFS